MTESQIQNLMDALLKKRVTKNSYGGGTYQSNLIDEDYRTIVESMIRSAVLDGRDQKMGTIEAKLFAYEQIIANSNFAPMIDGGSKRDSLIRENERLRRSLQEITEIEVPDGDVSDTITNYIGGVLSVAHEGLRSVEEGGGSNDRGTTVGYTCGVRSDC